jgi:hypothetical protein
MSWPLRLALVALLLAASSAAPARAGDPSVRADVGVLQLESLGASPSPNPLRDHGMVRVTAGLPAGARAGNPARATGLPGEVTLVDMSGRVIRTLWRGTLDRLAFDVPFSSRDEQGRAIPPGLYFVVVRAGEHRSISRIAVVR